MSADLVMRMPGTQRPRSDLWSVDRHISNSHSAPFPNLLVGSLITQRNLDCFGSHKCYKKGTETAFTMKEIATRIDKDVSLIRAQDFEVPHPFAQKLPSNSACVPDGGDHGRER
jgi:hypothetical protein